MTPSLPVSFHFPSLWVFSDHHSLQINMYSRFQERFLQPDTFFCSKTYYMLQSGYYPCIRSLFYSVFTKEKQPQWGHPNQPLVAYWEQPKSHYIILSILYTEGVTNTSKKGPIMKDLTCNDSVKSQQGDNFLNKFVQKAQK